MRRLNRALNILETLWYVLTILVLLLDISARVGILFMVKKYWWRMKFRRALQRAGVPFHMVSMLERQYSRHLDHVMSLKRLVNILKSFIQSQF
ncbi:MAG: hypothetical protein DRN15_09855 [Thermoprotei archaeon]|nr:MAG: hypothetical protein DRN15_09855 [Thermoprotei archaeon]RLF25340.1 MAG: hypothetical protein DRM97_02160 [Thermoprotei archaeon]